MSRKSSNLGKHRNGLQLCAARPNYSMNRRFSLSSYIWFAMLHQMVILGFFQCNLHHIYGYMRFVELKNAVAWSGFLESLRISTFGVSEMWRESWNAGTLLAAAHCFKDRLWMFLKVLSPLSLRWALWRAISARFALIASRNWNWS